jgi:hypothetical protein
MARPMPAFGNRSDGDAGAVLPVGAVEGVEQAGGGFDEVAGRAEGVVARHGAEADQPFVGQRRRETSRRSGLAGA